MGIISIIKGLFLQLFPSLGPKGVIDTQIEVYKRIKRENPVVTENDILNALIASRLNSPLSPTSKEEETAHYQPLIVNHNKTLEEVIWAIFEYENMESRKKRTF